MTYAVSKSTVGYGRNAGHRWRHDDIAYLRRLVRRGTPLKEVSLKLGRPVPAIRAKASSLGLKLDLDARDIRPRRSTPVQTPRPEARSESQSGPARQLELF